MRSITVPFLLVLVLPLSGAAAQGTATTWLTRLGRDTVAFERSRRTGDRLEGELVLLTPRTRIVKYAVTLAPDGSARRFEIESKPAVEAAGVPAPASGVLEFGRDTVVSITTRAGKTDTVRIPVSPGRAVPNAFYGWSLYELAVSRLGKGATSAPVEQVSLASRQANKTTVTRRGDSLAIDFFGSPMMMAVDREGRLLGVDGGQTTLKIRAEKAPSLDFDKTLESFVARERSGQSAGALSTRDTVNTTVAGATLWVDYGRPSKRGRTILGTVVPYGAVWRTGANAATQLRTSVPLELEGTVIPAGTYTLWTLPTSSGVQLIVNKQTGQWGTEYDESKDLVRVPLRVGTLGESAERFTIGVVEAGSGGEIRFDWDRVRWTARFTPKPGA